MSRQLRDYYRNKEVRNAQTKARRATPAGRAAVLLASARKRAESKGIPFDLDKEWLTERLEGECEISGVAFDFHAGPRNAKTPSLDRIDSSQGYTKNNCRVILWALNAAFGTWGERAFREILAAERNTPINPSYLFMAA